MRLSRVAILLEFRAMINAIDEDRVGLNQIFRQRV
jgi:hypothetical protein